MLDENLPTFFLKPSKESVRHDATIYLSQWGAEASPAYTLRHPDPASADSRNRYAAALCDSYNPEILFGEVLLIPEWTKATMSQEEIRKNGGVPPPPQAILPNEFAIQLYNPDQQVIVRHHPSTWNSGQHWEFEMPQQTFRQPSSSTLDRTQHDPSAHEATPTIELKWKREGKLSKDLICNLSAKSKNPDGSKRKHREPDIPMAFFRNMREMTVYEPNLSRVDIEDTKGFEVVLLLGAIVIKDVYFGQMRETFNISEASHQNTLTAVGRRSSVEANKSSNQRPGPPPRRHEASPNQGPKPPPETMSKPPPTDPRSQWEIDAETARLMKVVEQEERARKRREKDDEKRARQVAEEEATAARRLQASIDKETERLRKEYEQEQRRIHNAQKGKATQARPAVPSQASPGPYLQPYMSGAASGQYPARPASSTGFLGGGPAVKPKKSGFFGLRGGGGGDEGGNKLVKKTSAIF